MPVVCMSETGPRRCSVDSSRATPTADARHPREAVRRGGHLAALLLSLALIGGCSSTDEFLSGQPPPPTGTSQSFTDRFRTLFGGRTEGEVAAAPAPTSGSTEVDCPPTDIRQGASTLQMTAPGSEQAMAVRYQATFARTARQCAIKDGNLSIKVGVQGRVILGPAGTPGDTTLPLRYALVREGMEPKTVWTKLYLLPVAVSPDQPNVPFTHVVEDMIVPAPPGAEIDRYVIYIGFDPKGAEDELKQQKKNQRGRAPKAR